jgi:hypothetical protein
MVDDDRAGIGDAQALEQAQLQGFGLLQARRTPIVERNM